MKKVSISIGILILLLINQIGYAQSFEEKANSYLNNLVKQGKFSGTVLVAQDGNILLCKGYGPYKSPGHIFHSHLTMNSE